MNYLYFALLTPLEGGAYEVEFPEIAPYAATFGDDIKDALDSAKESLEGVLLSAEDHQDDLPKNPFDPQKLQLKQGELLVPIEVNTTLARERAENDLVKKTLTIPKYLNEMALEYKVNFSKTLTEALKDKMGIS